MLRALKTALIEQTPRARSVRVVGRDGDKLQLNLPSAKHRTLLSLDVWQIDDG